jgi:dihydrofolate reductase
MRKLKVAELLSLDGVMELPNTWAFPFMTEEIGMDVASSLSKIDTLLYGRVTYEEMADAWPSRTGEMADRFNSLPKYVVSTTLSEVTWNNSTLIKENIAEEVSKLKHEIGQDILLLGSRDLVHTLMQHDLIDEYDLTIFPIVLGSGGKRLFREGINKTLRLVESKTYSTGVVSLTYQPIRE